MSESTPEVSSSYPPPAHFAEHANARAELYREAEEDRLAFWAKQANRLSWTTPFTEVLDWSGAPFAKWFVGGELNVAYNCVDRHVEAGHGDRVAIHWEGEPVGDRRTLTYSDLLAEVSKAANALTDLGLVAGDRVAIYLPLIPEAVIAMLACARLGIMHSVVFGGFTAAALQARIVDAQAKLLITADGQFRRGKPSPLKAAADEALAAIPDCSVEHVLVVRRTGIEMAWSEGRDLWWHHVVGSASPAHTPEPFDSEHPLFLLYTSGTTGKPKGIMHTSGGYLTQCCYTMRTIFDVKPDSDVFWCTADIGWVTGHTYGVYGPLCNGVTEVLYEGTPDTPDRHRHFQIIEKYGVTISTAEVESALVAHSGVAEAAVVGVTDETTTQAICAFVVLRANYAPHDRTAEELRTEVARVISPIARPRDVHVVPELPKTRSGKIMRRLLRDVAENRELGDTSTLLDPTVFDAIRAAK